MNDRERLRDAASSLRGYASDLTSEIDTLIENHPQSEDMWDGSAADDFYESRGDVRTRLETLAGDLRDHADTLDDRADELDENDDGGES